MRVIKMNRFVFTIAHWFVSHHVILCKSLALSHLSLRINIHTKNDASGIKARSWMITSVIPRIIRSVFANIAQESPIQLDRSDVFNETLCVNMSKLRRIHRTFQNTVAKIRSFINIDKTQDESFIVKELIKEIFLCVWIFF